jgi:hypothetical protein
VADGDDRRTIGLAITAISTMPTVVLDGFLAVESDRITTQR